MAKMKLIKIDKDRLYAELRKRGVKTTDASREFGFNPSYIANCADRGRVTNTTALLLERFYGIKREAYEVAESVEAPAETAQPENGGGIDYDKLYQTIYTATYHAYRQVFIDRRNGKF